MCSLQAVRYVCVIDVVVYCVCVCVCVYIYIYICSYLSQFFLQRGMIQTKLQRKSKHILCSIHFLPENHAVYDTMRKIILHTDRPKTKI